MLQLDKTKDIIKDSNVWAVMYDLSTLIILEKSFFFFNYACKCAMLVAWNEKYPGSVRLIGAENRIHEPISLHSLSHSHLFLPPHLNNMLSNRVALGSLTMDDNQSKKRIFLNLKFWKSQREKLPQDAIGIAR